MPGVQVGIDQGATPTPDVPADRALVVGRLTDDGRLLTYGEDGQLTPLEAGSMSELLSKAEFRLEFAKEHEGRRYEVNLPVRDMNVFDSATLEKAPPKGEAGAVNDIAKLARRRAAFGHVRNQLESRVAEMGQVFAEPQRRDAAVAALRAIASHIRASIKR